MKVKEVIQDYNKNKGLIDKLIKSGKPYEGKNPLLKQLYNIKKEEAELDKYKKDIEELKDKIDTKSDKLKDTESKIKDLNTDFKNTRTDLTKSINTEKSNSVKSWGEYKTK